MKPVIRNSSRALILGALAIVAIASAAQAGSSWNGGYAYPTQPDDRGGWSGGGSGGRACATSHPAHRFFDGRLYCAGKDASGRWVSDARCEDDYGHKLVNDPGFVSEFRGDGCGPSGGYDRGYGPSGGYDRGCGSSGRYDRGVSYRDNGRGRVWQRERGQFSGDYRGGRRWNDRRGDTCR